MQATDTRNTKKKKVVQEGPIIDFNGPKITKPNGYPIDGVFMIISQLMGFASKYHKDEDLGAFHRRLALLLLANTYDETDAGKFAEMLLLSAREFSSKKSAAGKKGMESRYNKNETTLAPFPDGYTPDGTGGNPF